MSRSISSRIRSAIFPVRRDSGFESPEPEHKGLVITLCILAASVLWFAFSMQETYTQVIEFPTEVQNLSADRALSSLPPTSVRVQVEGEGVQVLRLYYNPPVLPIAVEPGEQDLLLVASEVVKNVSLQTITPRSVFISVEDRVFRKVPVVPAINVELARGFWMIGDMSVFPDSVTISGAASIVAGIEEWKTKKRQLGELSDSLNAMVQLSDSLAGLVQIGATEVRVTANIQEFTEASRTIEVRAIGLAEGENVSFVPSKVQVTYQVPLSQYDLSLAAEDFYVFVPYADTRRDEQGLVYPMLHLPEGLAIREARIDPPGLRYYDIRND
jgi:YbbR domain-containing protein